MSENAPTQYYARPTVVAEFGEESSNPGLIVKGRRLTIGEMRRQERIREELAGDQTDEERVRSETELFALYFVGTSKLAGPPVRSWNMVEENEDLGLDVPPVPVPLPTLETLDDEYDQATLVEIMNAFTVLSQARRVSRPLPQPSGDTRSSVEESIQTVAL